MQHQQPGNEKNGSDATALKRKVGTLPELAPLYCLTDECRVRESSQIYGERTESEAIQRRACREMLCDEVSTFPWRRLKKKGPGLF